MAKAARTPKTSCASKSRSTGASRRESIFDVTSLDEREGFARLRIEGRRAWAVFRHEAGGHRWQRVPPNDRRGRVHTSTVTVAVLREPGRVQVHLPDADLEWSAARGSGPGGQARNRRATAVRLVHVPTGITIRVNGGRSLEQSRKTALEVLRARLFEAEASLVAGARNVRRRAQIGTGMRADKVRTVRVQDGQVVDHRTGKKISSKRYLRGDWAGLLDGSC